jgi:molybdate transport system substrate-binding protein
MRLASILAASILSAALTSSPCCGAHSAELTILAGGGISGPLRELGPQFELTSGHKLTFFFGTAPELVKRATGGGPFDAGVVPKEVFDDAAARMKFARAPIDVAQVGLGLAVRAGAPKPDISTPEALKATLLKAQSIATVPASAAGGATLRAFERLGIADAVKPKIKALAAPAQIVELVAKGEAELGVFVTPVLSAPGVDLVGPFPAELQQVVVYAAAVAAQSKDAGAAQAFIAHLKTPEAAAILKAKGVEPANR